MVKRYSASDIMWSMDDGKLEPTKNGEFVYYSEYAVLKKANEAWQQNMREAYAAFSAMRNDLNELFPMQSAEADLLTGPEWSVACAAIVTAASDKFSTLEARLAEAMKALEPFATAAGNFDGFKITNEDEWFAYGGSQSAEKTTGAITVADLRAARRVREGGKVGG